MAKLRVLVALITDNNDYQKEQAAAAEDAARRLETDIEIVFAGNDAVNQSQQILKVIQGSNQQGSNQPSSTQRPDAILVEPVGTGMPQVAGAAAAAGIGWGILNRDVDYVLKLRGTSRAPIFGLTTDQEEVGRIQGRQFSALLKQGGGVLYIEGPGQVAQLRASGMQSTKHPNVEPKVIRGDWTEASGYRAVKSWLSLQTSQRQHIGVIGSQNDAMAIGARRAFEEIQDSQARKDWLKLPFVGCDGVPQTGQEWVRRGLLAATVVIPPTMGVALEMMAKALRSGVQPAPRTVSQPSSYPALDKLMPVTG